MASEELRNGWATIRQGAVFSLHATRAEAEEVVRRVYTDANGVRRDYSECRVVRLAVVEAYDPLLAPEVPHA